MAAGTTGSGRYLTGDFVGADVIQNEITAQATAAIAIDAGGDTIFEIGGPDGDAGLTGRKIIVDTYGGWGRHGGGAFSGKDPSKVDRSSAYFCRYVAKQVIASGLAKRAEIQVGYAIGMAKPVSVKVDTFGTGDERAAEEFVMNAFDFRPRAIIEKLELRSPIYRRTAAYGHFGRTPTVDRFDGRQLQFFPWERTDRAEDLQTATES